jgi:uncharacterized hydrophobic protein (TIGR00271 family)
LLHLRIVVPDDRRTDVLELLEHDDAVLNVAVFERAARKPDGDLVFCDVARESASMLLRDLRALGIGQNGSIAVEEVDIAISEAARRAVAAAPGSASDAVVWEEVEARTSESAELTASFVAFMSLAAMLAAVGVLTDSQILIIGAMVVGPEFGPLAGFAVAVVGRRADLARKSLAAVVVGFPVAIAAALALTVFLRLVNIAPATHKSPTNLIFISSPDWYSVVVALIAGVAGTLALTTPKSAALIGVLISVTTIPAAGNVAVAITYRDWQECRGAAAQLVINLVCVALAALGTLAVQRTRFAARLRRRRVPVGGHSG